VSAPVLLIATGLKREASLLAGPGRLIVAGGGDSPGLAAKLHAAIAAARPAALMSLGLGGALSPDLGVGDWVVADAVVSGARSWPTDPAWTAALRRTLGDAVASSRIPRPSKIAAGDAMVVDARAKAALHAASRAVAVDMESHVAGEVAARHGLPFAAARIISDGADRALPAAAQAGMKKDGGMDIAAVLRELVRDPRQLPALIRTGREAEVAFRGLSLLRDHDLLAGLGVGDADFGQLPVHVV
jgi:adenosylhomocysteine nucleosidase